MKKILMLCVLSIICGSLSANAASDVNSAQIEKIDALIEKLIIHQLTNPSDLEAKNATQKLITTRDELLNNANSLDEEVEVASAVEAEGLDEEVDVASAVEAEGLDEEVDVALKLEADSLDDEIVAISSEKSTAKPIDIVSDSASLAEEKVVMLTPRRLFISLFN